MKTSVKCKYFNTVQYKSSISKCTYVYHPLPPGVSPSPTTLLDRYSSPPTGSARRRLFVDPLDGEPAISSTTSSNSSTAPPAVTKTGQASLVTAIPAGQTVVTVATATVTANNGQTVTIPVQGEGLKAYY